MLYVKLMSGEDNLPDSSEYKNYRIIPIGNNDVFLFGTFAEPNTTGQSKYYLSVHRIAADREWEEVYSLTGNAYVMNENGKTIASHGAKFY